MSHENFVTDQKCKSRSFHSIKKQHKMKKKIKTSIINDTLCTHHKPKVYFQPSEIICQDTLYNDYDILDVFEDSDMIDAFVDVDIWNSTSKKLQEFDNFKIIPKEKTIVSNFVPPKIISPNTEIQYSPDCLGNYDECDNDDDITKRWKIDFHAIYNSLLYYYPDIQMGHPPHPYDIPKRPKSHPESIIDSILFNMSEVSVLREVSINKSTPTDFIFSVNGFVGVIECDGRYHFPEILYNDGDEKINTNKFDNDLVKLELSLYNNIPLLRINVCKGFGLKKIELQEIVEYFVSKVQEGYYNFCLFSHKNSYLSHVRRAKRSPSDPRFIYWDQSKDYNEINQKFKKIKN